MYLWIILLFIILIVLCFAKTGQNEEMIDLPPDFIETKVIKNIKDIEPDFKGIFLIESSKKQNLPIWSVKNKIIYCYSNVFLPFARFNFKTSDLDKIFLNLIDYKPVISNEPYPFKKIKLAFQNEYVNIQLPDNSSLICSDYFQEEVEYTFNYNKKLTLWDYFVKKYEQIFKPNDYKKYVGLKYTILNKVEHFKPEILIGLVKFLRTKNIRATSILDMTSGNGTRLVAALSLIGLVKYTGIEVYEMFYRNYESMINYYLNIYNKHTKKYYNKYIDEKKEAHKLHDISNRSDLNYDNLYPQAYILEKQVKNFVMHKGDLESVNIFGFHDIIFCSPHYTNNNIEWLQEYLPVFITKFNKNLRYNGFFCINLYGQNLGNINKILDIMKSNNQFIYNGCINFYGKDQNIILLWRKKKHIINVFKPIKPILSYFKVDNVKCEKLDLVGKLEFKKDITLVSIKIPNLQSKLLKNSFRQKVSKYPIWNIDEESITFFIYKGSFFMPFNFLYENLYKASETFINFKAKNVKKMISDQKIYILYDLPEKIENKETLKYKGKFVNIVVKEPQLWLCIDYFMSFNLWACRKKNYDSKWNNYLLNYKELSEFKDVGKIETWFKYNAHGCVLGKSDNIIYLIHYLRKDKHKMNRVLDFNTDVFNIMFGFCHQGCEYYEGWINNSYEYDKIKGMYYWWNTAFGEKKIKQAEFKKGDFNPSGKFDCIFSAIPFFGGDIKYGSKPEESDFDKWVYFQIFDFIEKSIEVLEKGGIMCLRIIESQFEKGGWIKEILTKSYLNMYYVGCICDTSNFLQTFTNFVWIKN